MTIYTLNDLLYAKGTSEPVRQMLLAMAEKIERLEARLAQPEKEWVGLTDSEREQIEIKANDKSEMTAWEYAHRVGEFTEDKLKEKNT